MNKALEILRRIKPILFLAYEGDLGTMQYLAEAVEELENPKQCSNCEHSMYFPVSKTWSCSSDDSILNNIYPESVCPYWEAKNE